MSVTIEFYVSIDPYNVCRTTPDLELEFDLAIVHYLQGIFVIPSAAFSQNLGSQLPLVWSRQAIGPKESDFAFDLTLTQHLTSQENLRMH